MATFRRLLLSGLCLFALAAPTQAQVQTGSILGVVSDTSNAVMPGVTVTLTGERLIGGAQTEITDATGAYRFDRLPPGTYNVKFELQGFKIVERAEVAINAAFVATINVKLEVGTLAETITVTGESPTIDTRSNLQQTVMDQQVLEGIPSGRDPWSLAKLIPGVQVATYDVGGTQSIQQSSLSSHGSNTADVNYNIDGATVNWPGGGGGATMLYYDQGMFEEVNYMTSAIPAEVMAGGVSINMVTKTAGNPWRGNLKYSFANDDLQVENHKDLQAQFPSFLGNPTEKTYDVNLSGGGAILKDRLWVNGTIRRWVVDKRTNARNPDGTQALDDNTLKNYSGKVVASLSTNQKLIFGYLWNDKIRGHRVDTPPNTQEEAAALVQTNPASNTQVKYTNIFGRMVYESSFSVMDGQTNYNYQPNQSDDIIRKVDNGRSEAFFAATRHEEQPNQRLQFDNIVSYQKSGWGGEHFFKTGVQFARLSYESQYEVRGDHYVEYNNGVPTQVRLFNTPTTSKNLDRVLGVFFQDAWTVTSRLTLNLGMRYDHNTGILPAQSNPAGQFIPARSIDETEVVSQNLFVWRAGAAYDIFGTGNTAIKANYSRYGLQVGIDRVTEVNPFANANQTCPWTDPNGNGRFDAGEVNFAQCPGFAGISTFYPDANGPDWPYSDEVTAGFEHQLIRDMRVGAMYYYRTNRKQLGTRNRAVPSSAYTPFTVNVPNGPSGITTATVYNLNSSFLGLQDNIRDNDSYLDTDYQGVEFTASKRLSNRWSMVAGLTIGQNTGGLNAGLNTSGQSSTADLNDPNITSFQEGIIGNDSPVGFRLSGTYVAPWDLNIGGSLVSNGGYPFVSTYQLTRAVAATQGITLTRATQNIFLTERGDERRDSVTLVDISISRDFRFGSRRISPRIDFFNITNSSTITTLQPQLGGTYLNPTEIVAPRIIRLGFVIDF